MTLHTGAGWCNQNTNHDKDDSKMIKLTFCRMVPSQCPPPRLWCEDHLSVSGPEQVSGQHPESPPCHCLYNSELFSVCSQRYNRQVEIRPAGPTESQCIQWHYCNQRITVKLAQFLHYINIDIRWNSHLMKVKHSLMIRCCCIQRRPSLEEEGKKKLF